MAVLPRIEALVEVVQDLLLVELEVLVAAQMVVEVIHHKAESEQPIQVAVAVVV